LAADFAEAVAAAVGKPLAGFLDRGEALVPGAGKFPDLGFGAAGAEPGGKNARIAAPGNGIEFFLLFQE
jgi:hypothetical protein